MERLTKRELAITTDGREIVVCNHEKQDCNDNCMYGRCRWNNKALEKLKAYEDKQEQGLLLELPCKVDEIAEQLKGGMTVAEIINVTERMRIGEPVTSKFRVLTDRMKEYMDFLNEKTPPEDYAIWNEKLVRALKFLGDYKVDSEV